MLATWTLWRREMVRFLRQRHRVIGAMGTPIVFWLLLGSGVNDAFMPGDAKMDYLAYFFPGTVVMILLFTAIFSVISVIEDRREGFLQGVLASPAPRSAIALGKIFGGATLATGQGILLVAFWPLVGAFPGWAAMLEAVVAMFIAAVGLTALGLALAWPMRSTAGFHALMNLLLLPMWFLSGAIFPLTSAPGWMKVVMLINPLTYANSWIASVLVGPQSPAAVGVSQPIAIVVTIGFALVMIGVCTRQTSRVVVA